ncbi:hypothetical protein QFZ32_004925 [Streptomyces canus]|uniref:Uncharacterized protein n=1 Tax=Streptomyces canus TaxID=58343 RepID=A0AAW8FJY8_9ACTN|nr:hypothetical protein [Streptomyces canus]MDQ0909470.1 hypothetical protein [Streptomyces canus]MDQ1069485.1 hypothetical protein [Streptomyces canus]
MSSTVNCKKGRWNETANLADEEFVRAQALKRVARRGRDIRGVHRGAVMKRCVGKTLREMRAAGARTPKDAGPSCKYA